MELLIGDELKVAQIRFKVSNKALASAMGVSLMTINRWRSGDVFMSMRHAKKLESYFRRLRDEREENYQEKKETIKKKKENNQKKKN